MKKSATTNGESPSRLIDARIKELNDWRGKTLARVRALIKQADPDVIEEWKWNVPVWSHDGIICTGEAYKGAVKLTFAKGASLKDLSALQPSLEGSTRRAIDIHEGEQSMMPSRRCTGRCGIEQITGPIAGSAPRVGTRPGSDAHLLNLERFWFIAVPRQVR